ncbi:hypothetical protein [Pseudoduganella sp. R-34]|uniref:hypothetical protein n=1 Tax=Pseudoduganella sp. R-34 TaxID=3404062 RepID=UPI003CECC271
MTSHNKHLQHLDEIAREAHAGNYARVGVLSTGERLYVAVASGRMRELASGDSIAYAVDRIGPVWMAHMLEQWRSERQPLDNGETAVSHAGVTEERPAATPPSSIQDPMVRSLMVVAAVRGYYLHALPGGTFAVYRKAGSSIEPVAAWTSWKEVAELCGAGPNVTLRAALERDGFAWPADPDAFLADYYKSS